MYVKYFNVTYKQMQGQTQKQENEELNMKSKYEGWMNT